MSLCYSLLHFGSSGRSLHLALLCFVWNNLTLPPLLFFGTYRSNLVALFRGFCLCRDPVSISNIDANQLAAESTSTSEHPFHRSCAFCHASVLFHPCMDGFWDPLPADRWNKFHMSWHKSLMDRRTSGSFTAINWPDLCVSSLSDDCVLLALFSCLLSKPLLWAQLYINAFAFPEITFSLWRSSGESKSIDIDGFVTRTNWFRLAFEHPAMWKKGITNSRARDLSGREMWKPCVGFVFGLRFQLMHLFWYIYRSVAFCFTVISTCMRYN